MFLRTAFVCHVLLLCTAWATQDDAPVVSIAGLGDVRGVTSTSFRNGYTINSFLSIPFGKAPSGDRRFKPAVAASGWEGILDGSKNGPVCPQPTQFKSAFTPNGEGDESQSSEDCLRLDVHTRQVESGKLLPVFVFLHGGAFTIGGSHRIRPEILLDQEIVLVVPQFRLGPLGFLNLNTADIPGNAALYDQNLALKWVQDHISDFGGDPSRVTLGGHSTGAAMATHHMFSSLSTGLFHRVIAHGGSGTSHWGITPDPMSPARNFAKALSCDINLSTEDVSACILGKSTEELINAYSGEDLLLSPSVQNLTSGSLPDEMFFIREYTFDKLASYNFNSVPLLAGSNKHEGLLYLEYFYNSWLVPNNYVNNEEYLKYHLVNHIADTYDVPDSSGVLAEALTRRYLDQNTLGNFEEMFNGLVDLCGSSFVKGNVYRLVQFNSANSSSYLYSFNFFGKDHLLHHAQITPSKDGVIHGDELIYLFPQNGIEFDEDQGKVSDIIGALWTNFIINGHPTPDKKLALALPSLSPFTREQDNFLIIEQNATAVLAYNYRPQYTIARSDGLEDTFSMEK